LRSFAVLKSECIKEIGKSEEIFADYSSGEMAGSN